jgi:hypothetical protein
MKKFDCSELSIARIDYYLVDGSRSIPFPSIEAAESYLDAFSAACPNYDISNVTLVQVQVFNPLKLISNE